jgi:Gpi18-like mannosyltransferase
MRRTSHLKEERDTLGILAAHPVRLVPRHCLSILVVAVGVAITIAIRVQLFGFHSGDLDNCALVWCDHIKKFGLAQALKSGIIDYNPTYIYMLWLVTKLPFDRVVTIKLCSVLCDYVCAAALASIVYRVHHSKLRAAVAAFALLVAPTVVFNGALWGQCDMVYTAPLVVALATAFGKRPYATTALFGLAISVKLQAIFLLPLLGVWVLRRELPWRSLLLVPVAFLACLVPAWIAGCPFVDLLMIYPKQTQHYTALTLNAPSIFNWLPDDGRWLGSFGLWFALAAIFMVSVACLYSRKRTTTFLTTQQAMVFSCLTPFLLPHMHERYIFLGDVISILYAFLRPSRFWVAFLVIAASFTSYFWFLFGKLPVPLAIASVMLGVACVFLTFDLLRSLYPGAFAAQREQRVRVEYLAARGPSEPHCEPVGPGCPSPFLRVGEP